MTRETYFITGGNGFVGKQFVHYCLKYHPNMLLICLVRSMDASNWMAEYPQIIRVHGDLCWPASYQEQLVSSDYIFHMAALVGLRDGQEFYRYNTEATQVLLSACKLSERLKRFVFVSSIAAVDRPKNRPVSGPLSNQAIPCPSTDYGKSKRQAEELIENSGFPFTILRPSFIYGRYLRVGSSVDKLCQDIRRQLPYVSFPFSGRISAIHTDDLADVLWLAAQSSMTVNKTYFAANPEPLSVSTAIQALSQTFGIEYHGRHRSPEVLERLHRFCNRRAANPMIPSILFEDAFYCDSQPLCDALDWQPQWPYEEGLQHCFQS